MGIRSVMGVLTVERHSCIVIRKIFSLIVDRDRRIKVNIVIILSFKHLIVESCRGVIPDGFGMHRGHEVVDLGTSLA